MKRFLPIFLLISPALADVPAYDAEPINYSTTRPADAVSRLTAPLESADDLGVLPSLLRALDIPVSSQTLVFSKTSLQRTHISPDNPRAIFFNDDTYVGYVPGGRVLEVASTDPHIGTTFYTVDQHPAGVPKLLRQTDNCLQCHAANMTRDLPGLLIRSVFPNEAADPILPAGTFLTTHESPLKERWGGWYVTSPLPGASMANTLFSESDPSNPKPLPALVPADHVTFADYPSKHSDPVALLLLAHQVEAHNRLSRAQYATQQALHDEEVMNAALHESPPGHTASTVSRIRHACDPLVEYLLFSNEASLDGDVTSPTTFPADFAARGPRDPKGRSLRDLDLHTRLFKYPCSYLIYSPSFDALPGPALDYVYERLHAVLTNQDTSKEFAHLTAGDRQAILEILLATKANLPSNWKP